MPELPKDEFEAIFREAVDGIKPSADDRVNLVKYGSEVARLYATARVSTGAAKDAALKEMQGYEDAISLVVARYEVRAGAVAEKALARVLAALTKFAIAAVG